MKNKIIAIAAAVTLAVVPTTANAQQNTINTNTETTTTDITSDQIKSLAASMLPAGSMLVHMTRDEGDYILKYYGSISKELYSVTLSKDGSIVKMETENYLPSKTNTTAGNIKISEAHKIVQNEIKDAEITNTELSVVDTVDGKSIYIIRFKTSALYGNYTINAKTSTIENRVIKAGTPFPHDVTTNYISWNTLKNKALNEVSGGVVTDVNLVPIHGTVNFEVELCSGSMVHKLMFNAFTGDLISHESQTDGWNDNNYKLTWQYREYHPFNLVPDSIADDIISVDDAITIAMGKAPQGELVSISLDYYDNTGIYEGKLEKDDLEYYFKIDALSKKLIYRGGNY